MKFNYIHSPNGSLIEIKGDNKSAVENSLRECVYLAKSLNCIIELIHKSGNYLVDKNGEVETLSGIEPNKKLLPLTIEVH